MSSIARLPCEVLSLVFVALVEDWEISGSDTLRFRSWHYLWWDLQSVLVVCKLWRSVALHTPHVWRNVFERTPRELHPSDWVFYTPTKCFALSRATLLNVHLACTADTRYSFFGLASQAGALNRIERVQLVFEDYEAADLSALPSCPSVSELTVTTRITTRATYASHLSSMNIFHLLSSMSNVRSLVLGHVARVDMSPNHSSHIVPHQLSLNSLRYLKIMVFCLDDFIRLFRVFSAPNLLEISIVLSGLTTSSGLEDEPVLASVQSLGISGCLSGRAVTKILRMAPNLSSLRLYLVKDHMRYRRQPEGASYGSEFDDAVSEIASGRILSQLQDAYLWDVDIPVEQLVLPLMSRNHTVRSPRISHCSVEWPPTLLDAACKAGLTVVESSYAEMVSQMSSLHSLYRLS